MAARKKKRELSEKAQKRIRQRNLHVGITVIAAIVIIFSVIQFTLWRYVSKADEEHICKNVFIGKTDVSGMTKEEAVKAVDNTLGDYRNKQLVLKVKDQGADVSIEEMGAEVENIDKLAEKAVGYGKNGSIWSRYQKIHNLDKKKYVIDESFKVDEAKLRELIQERAVPLEQKAVNASASYNGSGFDLTDEAEGYTVDVDKSVKKIKNFMNKKWNYEDAEVELKLDTEEPTIKKTDLESLQDELGSYTTNAGWGDRVQNIRRATELINGTVVMPGEEFSVEQATLPYTEENGYVAGSAYENGQIVESIGGGLCQVSTTLYNAVLYAELEVTQGNTVFTYLDAFCKPEHFERYLSDYPNLDELKAHYTRGGLGDMKVKKFLAAIMQEELTPIRERRKEFEKDIPAIYEMLRRGCETARATAAETLDDVRKAMKINYFDDAELIAEQAKRFGQE